MSENLVFIVAQDTPIKMSLQRAGMSRILAITHHHKSWWISSVCVGEQAYPGIMSPTHRGCHKCKNCTSKPKGQNFTKFCAHTVGISINKDLTCHFDTCMWAWPISLFFHGAAQFAVSWNKLETQNLAPMVETMSQCFTSNLIPISLMVDPYFNIFKDQTPHYLSLNNIYTSMCSTKSLSDNKGDHDGIVANLHKRQTAM